MKYYKSKPNFNPTQLCGQRDEVYRLLGGDRLSKEVAFERGYINALYALADAKRNEAPHDAHMLMAGLALEFPMFTAPNWDKNPLDSSHPRYYNKKTFDERNPGFDYAGAMLLFDDILYALAKIS